MYSGKVTSCQILALLALLLIGCRKPNKQLTPDQALDQLMHFYQEQSSQGNEIVSLYFLYGTEIWSEYREQERFKLFFACQFRSAEDSQPMEYLIALDYEPQAFKTLAGETLWYHEGEDLETFKRKVSHSAGFLSAKKEQSVYSKISTKPI